jgi:hypothetical protein
VLELELCIHILLDNTQNQQIMIDGFDLAEFKVQTNPARKKNHLCPVKLIPSFCLEEFGNGTGKAALV